MLNAIAEIDEEPIGTPGLATICRSIWRIRASSSAIRNFIAHLGVWLPSGPNRPRERHRHYRQARASQEQPDAGLAAALGRQCLPQAQAACWADGPPACYRIRLLNLGME